MEILKSFIKGDKAIWVIYGFLMFISIVEVFSASSTLTHSLHEYWRPFVRHFMFLAMGTGIVIVIHFIQPKYFKPVAILLLFISACLLIFTLLFGVATNEAVRWLKVGSIQFQPSELAKLAVISIVALLLSRMKDSEESINWTFKAILIIVFVFCGLIVSENLSTAAMLFTICFLMMFIGRIPFWKLMKVGGIMAAIAITLFILAPHIPAKTPMLGRLPTWYERIMNHSPEITAETSRSIVFNDDNYQVSHSKIAIARGGVFGKLPGNSQQRDFLPQAYSDFIYAIIIEELGLIGGLFVLFLYLMLVFRAGVLARRCKRSFYAFLMMGCALILVFQAFINMAVAVNLIPVTGQPLPLISRGGTSTLVTCVYFGIMLSISRTTIEPLKDDEQEVLAKGERLVNEEN